MLRKQLDAAKGNPAFGQGGAQGGAAGGSGATVATGPGGLVTPPATGTAPPPPTNLTTAPGANTPTGDPAAPYKNNGQPPPAKPQDFNGSEDAFLQSLMNGANNVDTGYLQQIFGDQAAHNRVNARASMGRAGFGSSGALSAMEGDQGRKDTEAMNQAVATARQQGIQNALSGINADATLEGTRANDAILREILGLGNDPGGGAPGGGGGDGGITTGGAGGHGFAGDAADYVFGTGARGSRDAKEQAAYDKTPEGQKALADEQKRIDANDKSGQQSGVDMATAQEATAAPHGAIPAGAQDGYSYYYTVDGGGRKHWVKVKVGGGAPVKKPTRHGAFP